VVAVGLTAASRVALLMSDRTSFNADEAVTGIAVRHILHGQLYLMYPGQGYGGTLEQYLQALTYLVFRLPQKPFTLRIPLVVLDMITCWLTYLCARWMLSGRWAPAVAALVYAVAPWFNLVGSVTSFGFYAVSQLLCAGGLYCAIRLSRAPDRPGWAVAFGLCCGFGFWTAAFTCYLLIPASLWLLPVLVHRWRAALVLVAGAIVGALPALVWIARHHTIPLPTGSNPATAWDRLMALIDPVYREFLGVAFYRGSPPPASTAWLSLPIAWLMVAVFVAAVWRRRAGLLAVARGRVSHRNGMDVLLIAVPLVVALYCVSPSGWYIGTPRYLFPIYPLLAIAAAAMVPRQRRVAGVVGLVIVGVSATLCAQYFVAAKPLLGTAPQDAALRRVVDRLLAEHETQVYSGYWTAMPLSYTGGGRVTVATCVGPQRFPADAAAVRAHSVLGGPVYVVNPAEPWDAQILEALQAHHVAYRTTRLGVFDVLDEIRPDGGPIELGLVPS
jgi:hypothetical protein